MAELLDRNYAWIENGVVTNTIVWNGDTSEGAWAPPEGVTLVLIPADNPTVSIGWTYDGTNFHQPA